MKHAHPTQLILSILAILGAGSTAAAQPSGPPSQREIRAELLPDGQIARLAVTWAQRDADCSTQLLLPGDAPRTLHDGPAAATLVAGHGVLLVASAIDHAREPFQLRVVTPAGGRLEVGPPTAIARPGARQDVPFAVVATVLPEGFAIFFQEVETNDPTAAHAYLVRTDRRGVPTGPAQAVNIPWSLVDAVWNGQGYHLALIYPGGGGGMRLSMVSFTAEGTQQQHPDWSSRPGSIADVHLVAATGRVLAFYRGGAGGNRLLESDVTQIGAWGREPPAARDHGALPSNRVIVVEQARATARPRPVPAE